MSVENTMCSAVPHTPQEKGHCMQHFQKDKSNTFPRNKNKNVCRTFMDKMITAWCCYRERKFNLWERKKKSRNRLMESRQCTLRQNEYHASVGGRMIPHKEGGDSWAPSGKERKRNRIQPLQHEQWSRQWKWKIELTRRLFWNYIHSLRKGNGLLNGTFNGLLNRTLTKGIHTHLQWN